MYASALRSCVVLMALILLLSCEKDAILVENPWIREAPPNARALAAYMTITNNTNTDRTLVAFTSREFEFIELHRTEIKDEMVRMIEQDSITIPAGQSVELSPGGYHLMLIGSSRPFKAGEQVSISIKFGDGMSMAVTMPVKRVAGSGHHH